MGKGGVKMSGDHNMYCSANGKDWKAEYENMRDTYHYLLKKTEPQYRELSDEDRLAFTKAYFNIHPEAHLSEQFKIKLYELNEFARAILRKAQK